MSTMPGAALALVLTCCACTSDDNEVPVPGITAIELSANSYWSVGDWWRVVYGSDRTCEWTGNVETDRKGQYVGMLDVGQWDVLVGCIEGLAMEQLQSHYDDARHDARHLVLTVHRGDRSKTVDDYNNAGPPVMREAETILLGMANRVAWQERPR